MYERGEAGPRPNPKLLNSALREGFLAQGRLDVGYVNGIPYGLCTVTDDFPQLSRLSASQPVVRREREYE